MYHQSSWKIFGSFFWPHCLHSVCRCGRLLQMLHLLWSLCAGHNHELCKNSWTNLYVFWGFRLMWAQGTMYYMGVWGVSGPLKSIRALHSVVCSIGIIYSSITFCQYNCCHRSFSTTMLPTGQQMTSKKVCTNRMSVITKSAVTKFY